MYQVHPAPMPMHQVQAHLWTTERGYERERGSEVGVSWEAEGGGARWSRFGEGGKGEGKGKGGGGIGSGPFRCVGEEKGRVAGGRTRGKVEDGRRNSMTSPATAGADRHLNLHIDPRLNLHIISISLPLCLNLRLHLPSQSYLSQPPF
jgi:hypothetical protein